MTNKTSQKISDKLNHHASIIMACSTFGCKYIPTLEKDNCIYAVRVYENGKLYKQKMGMFYRGKRLFLLL